MLVGTLPMAVSIVCTMLFDDGSMIGIVPGTLHVTQMFASGPSVIAVGM